MIRPCHEMRPQNCSSEACHAGKIVQNAGKAGGDGVSLAALHPPMKKFDGIEPPLDLTCLAEHRLFAGLSAEDLKTLPVLFRVDRHNYGDRIITEGEHGSTLYLIYQGGVDIFKQVVSREGDHQEKIATLRAGDSFGEMELLDHQPRSATVVAHAATMILALDNIDLDKLSQQDTRLYVTLLHNLAREVSRRLRAADQYLAVSLFSIREQSNFRLFPKEKGR
jgi:CRP/FNR family transcriptional regulator, cyclic AMP receptor protein